jgi:hypothetical protein
LGTFFGSTASDIRRGNPIVPLPLDRCSTYVLIGHAEEGMIPTTIRKRPIIHACHIIVTDDMFAL